MTPFGTSVGGGDDLSKAIPAFLKPENMTIIEAAISIMLIQVECATSSALDCVMMLLFNK